MKKINKLSLQWRVTILTAVILIISSITLTIFSMYNAEKMLYPIVSNDDSLNVVGSEDITEYTEMVPAITAQERKNKFDSVSILFCVAITILGTGASFVLSGHALSPVKNLNKTIRLIDEHNLQEKLPNIEQSSEISELTDSFNRMLDRLEQAFNRQKRFTASAAHELKTPLATIKAGIQVLDRDKKAKLLDYKENSKVIVKSVDRLTSVVNDLLLLASCEESNQNMMEEIKLDMMFEAILSDISSLYEKNNITYKMDLLENSIVGNTDMLYRVFYNLIENAYKYNKINGKIIIKSYFDKNFIIIEIEDTGIGIPEEHQALIFEPFYRVDASRSRKIAGAGLGLSIVKAIIDEHGGSISFESKQYVGTKFIITLSK